MSLFEKISREKVLILDGAMGTQIQNFKLDNSVWENAEGCNELLNKTAQKEIQKIHESYIKAGADIIKTNTFGAMPWVLKEYELQDMADELCFKGVKLAKDVCDNFKDKPRFVATSFGPGTKLPSLKHIEYDEMYEGYLLCAKAAIRANTDIFLVETAQDPLQIKSAINAISDACKSLNVKIPIMVSVTIELSGTMLIGTDASTIVTILEPFDIFSLGFNCGTGPEQIEKHLKIISSLWNRPISIHANAGLPQNRGGYTYYPMGPEEFAKLQCGFLDIDGVSFLGGCCGTTPQHILALSKMIQDKRPKKPNGKIEPSISSLYESKTLVQNPAPFLVGERSNATGSKAFRELLLNERFEEALGIANEQIRSGAHAIDVSVGFAGRDESKDMKRVISDYNTKVSLPIMADSTQIEALEIALKNIAGRAIINSVNLEDGEEKFHKICSLAKQYGAALVCLCIDEKGMAKTKEQKIQIAQRIYDLATKKHGFRGYDLVFDMLTFTVGSGNSEYYTAAIETIEAINEFSNLHSEVGFVLGVSNISFGLDKNAREYLNSVFLHHCVKAGLTMAIVNVKNIIPLHKITQEDLTICNNLLFNRTNTDKPLFDFINHFSNSEKQESKNSDENDNLTTKERISKFLIDGDKEMMLKLLVSAKEEIEPEIIINEILINAMKEVGELFGSGKMQLPFVLQSAEVMKASVDFLNSYLPKKEKKSATTIVIGTVKGDVHDVGKNLVDIILANNGFRVINIGIKAEIGDFIKAYKEYNADAIGMSGLLVKSTAIMRDNLIEMKQQGINVPIILGGAALNEGFVEEFCRPFYDGAIFYCKDAFEGITAMSRIENKNYDINFSKYTKEQKQAIQKEKVIEEILAKEIILPTKEDRVPTPPFWGRKVFKLEDKNLAYEWINHKIMFSKRWGYSGKKLNKKEKEEQLNTVLLPLYEKVKKIVEENNLFEPTMLYGYWSCRSEDTKLYIFDEKCCNEENLDNKNAIIVYDFPRTKKSPHRSISDFFHSNKKDVVAFTCVSVGKKFSEFCANLYKEGRYKEYYELNGVSVELAEALAEMMHKQIRIELGIIGDEKPNLEDVRMKKYQGCRYSFGYPACPSLSDNRHIFDLLKPEEFGITLSETFQMHPEQTTTALVVYNKEAKYF
ncbi:MAG: methionine synthase [Campylobacteraceae bacterium]|jgi:5-methyltetrahydrofolate--homocysteine methyltransferase|nr:methionine synthase [Campylobacteraceae bacterium]